MIVVLGQISGKSGTMTTHKLEVLMMLFLTFLNSWIAGKAATSNDYVGNKADFKK